MAESKQESKQALRVAILATDGVEEVELTEPRKFLEDQGAKTVLIAPHGEKLQAFKHHDKAGQYAVDLTLDQASSEDFTRCCFRAATNADALRVEPDAQEFAREFDRQLKPMAVICHAPWLLVSAGLVKGRTLTSYHTIRERYRAPAETAGFGSGGRSQLGYEPTTQRHPKIQREDERAFLGRRTRRAVAVQRGVYLSCREASARNDSGSPVCPTAFFRFWAWGRAKGRRARGILRFAQNDSLTTPGPLTSDVSAPWATKGVDPRAGSARAGVLTKSTIGQEVRVSVRTPRQTVPWFYISHFGDSPGIE